MLPSTPPPTTSQPAENHQPINPRVSVLFSVFFLPTAHFVFFSLYLCFHVYPGLSVGPCCPHALSGDCVALVVWSIGWLCGGLPYRLCYSLCTSASMSLRALGRSSLLACSVLRLRCFDCPVAWLVGWWLGCGCGRSRLAIGSPLAGRPLDEHAIVSQQLAIACSSRCLLRRAPGSCRQRNTAYISLQLASGSLKEQADSGQEALQQAQQAVAGIAGCRRKQRQQ